MLHKLKIEKNYFEAVLNGIKNFEIRFNDRDYHEGDILELCEFVNGQYTGRSVRKVVNYIFLDLTSRFLQPGYVILGLFNAPNSAEWIRVGWFFNECSFCKKYSENRSKYCSNCGSKMENGG